MTTRPSAAPAAAGLPLSAPEGGASGLRTAARERLRSWALGGDLPYGVVAAGLLVAIHGAPLAALVSVQGALSGSGLARTVLLVLAPLAWAAGSTAIAGLLSRPYQHAVRPGRFARDLDAPDYRARRLYGLCWTAVFYNKPAYFLCLSIPALKAMTFRLFGYRGQLDFTLYPDTWIRDLPLLDIGKGAYVSNRATLGTNLVLSNGTLLVDRIRLGEGALVGHLCMVAAGATIGDGAEVGVGSAVGVRTRIERGAYVGPASTVGHRVVLEEGAQVGMRALVAHGVVVERGARLEDGAVTRARQRIADRRPDL